jgi:hypothetical protein
MANKKKAQKRLGKVIKKQSKELEKNRLNENFRNIFVQAGILKERRKDL